MFDLEGHRMAADLCASLRQRGVLASAFGPQLVRMVTHYDVDRPGIDRAIAALQSILR